MRRLFIFNPKSMAIMNLSVFCDFDGTVAQNDVGNLVFTRFGDPDHWWKLVEEWRTGQLEGREMWRRQAAVSTMTPETLDAFAATQAIDPHFPEFVDFCQKNDIPISITSDGMDAYIDRILAHHGLDLEICSNQLTMEPDGKISLAFPYYEMGCGKCANCKGYHLSNARQKDVTLVYVGDGYSDICALAEADITFAKDDLLSYCQERELGCTPFSTFKDVRESLEKLL